jgi:ribosomal protein L5
MASTEATKQQKADNPMRDIRIEKLVLDICVGEVRRLLWSVRVVCV